MNQNRIGVLAVIVLAFFLAPRSPAWTPVQGPVEGVWDLEGSPYIAVGDIQIWGGDTLVIEPLVEVRFNAGLTFTVYGTLLAQGTADSLITFTSHQPYPMAGDWGPIYFYSNEPEGSVLDYCIVEYGGAPGPGTIRIEYLSNPTITHCLIRESSNYGIWCHNQTTPLIADCIIRDNEKHGIACENMAAPTISDNTFIGNSYAAYVDGSSQPVLSGNTASGNTHDGVEVHGSLIVDAHWSDLPYYLSGGLYVEQGVTLTIDPGMKIVSASAVSLTVYGTIHADGTPSDPITFTSQFGSSDWGRWGHLGLLESSTGNIIDACIFEYGGSDNQGLILCQGAEAAISNSLIRYSPNAGIRVTADADLSVTGTTFIGTEWPIRADASAFLTVAGNTAQGNVHDGISIQGTAANGSTWHPDLPYIVAEYVSVDAGDTVTLLPGTEVQFLPYRGMTIRGTLLAVGTPSDSIIFTSSQLYPGGGDWNAVDFIDSSSSGSILQYCTLAYGGANGTGTVRVSDYSDPTIANCRITRSAVDGVQCVNRAAPTISRCLIEANDRYGIFISSFAEPDIKDCRFFTNEFAIFADGDVAPTLVRNTAYGNLHDGVAVSGTISSDVTWSNLPHIVIAGMEIAATATLTVDPGVDVQFVPDAHLNVYGKLEADGELVDPIIFTAEPGASESGHWGHLGFIGPSSSQNLLDYCIVEFAGSDGLGALFFESSAGGTVARSEVRANLAHGIECRDHASPSVLGSSLLANASSGVRAEGESTPTITNSNIVGNARYGVENLDPLVTIDAEDNWWGSPSGPGGAGPGTGDSVTAWVDYDPWRDSPYLPSVTISLTPDTIPIVIPPQGGGFGYTGVVINHTSQQQTLAGWIDVRLPNGTRYGPLLGPITLNLAPEETLSVHLQQNVPGMAPAGHYRFNGYLGTHPSPASDYSWFAFEKAGPLGIVRED
ncbi:hypothetical protein AMJ82_10100 [candidate division TA06 bacterium SM23_40]|uniref:Right handed beta helix domain-containing protein n=1 Tax=candidate division TA06 bacterium SM23_40 TaxID=1703774 RepID=A0A0S8G4G9_UNCT6|nr:MAG: hypothetical protein AMJ82_10100 [candidate division TA06 bacterium SM23_40]